VARRGLDRDRVVDAAAAIADADGLSAVTLARVAAQLGVRSPSLYAHVDGMDGLRRGVALRGLRELGEVLRGAAVGRAGPDAVVAIADAYREYALKHPGSYAATQMPPGAADPELQRAAGDIVDVVLGALRAWGLSGEDAVHAARALRAAVHGFVTLEGQGGFGLPVSLDASFARLVALVTAGLGPPGVRDLRGR
jgi:AcrR family transcriptional regulator